MMAASRLTQRMEAALQLAQQQDAALPHLVQIRIDATQAPTAGVKPAVTALPLAPLLQPPRTCGIPVVVGCATLSR